jgi:hypothetical protein
MDKIKFFNLLIKDPSGKVIKTAKLNYDTAMIENLKFEAAYRLNIPYDKFELYWNDEILSPESELLKNVVINGEKLPVSQFNVNNVIMIRF